MINQVGVSLPARNLIRRICELGWMYKTVSAAIAERVTAEGGGGLVDQSFCAVIQAELGIILTHSASDNSCIEISISFLLSCHS